MSIEPYEDILVKMARNRKRAALAAVAIKTLLLLDIDVVRMMFGLLRGQWWPYSKSTKNTIVNSNETAPRYYRSWRTR
jgi:hypothetical protein